MAKQNSSTSSSFFKKLFFLLLFASVGAGGYLAWQHRDEVTGYLDNATASSIRTFEIAYTPELIMQKNARELLRTKEHSYGKAYVKFLPQILLQVKYSQDHKQTEESECLWDLVTGEMVLDTATFETTHGFEDCINAQATSDDFSLLHAILRKGTKASREELSQELCMNPDLLNERLELLRRKHLVTLKLDSISLHFQSPLLKVAPRTAFKQPLVWKVASKESQITPCYTKDQVQRLAKAAFGSDFAIRSVQDVFVPVVGIEVQNPDGSTLKTYFNGITGKRIALNNVPLS